MAKTKTHKLTAVLLALIVLAVLCAIFLFGENEAKQALALSRQNEAVSNFVEKNPDAKSNVTAISGSEVKALAEKYPAVYGDLPEKTLYRVTYEKDGSGYTCLVDTETKETLSCVRTLSIGMKIGG